MSRPLTRLRNLFASRAVRTQAPKKFCEQSIPPPSPKDFLLHSVGGDPYYAFPFQFRNHFRFTLTFLVFFGIPFWAGPLVVHFQIWKRNLNG